VGDLAIDDVADPEPGSDEVIVEVLLAGICGSDIHGYLGHSDRRMNNLPLVMGHEVVGQVIRLGTGVVAGPAIGDRVAIQPMIACHACIACRSGHPNVCPNMQIIGIELPGGFATHVAVPARLAIPVPCSLTNEQAVMAEPLAIEVRLYREYAASLQRNVLILGAGSQGLLAVQLARMMGIPQIIVSDTLHDRLQLALRLGATDVIHALEEDVPARVMSLTHGVGVELAAETAGASAARQNGLDSLARGGTFAIVGLGQGHTSIDFLDLVSQEKSVRGVYCYTDDDFARAIEILTTQRIHVEPMISVLPLECGADAFASIVDGTQKSVKILLDPMQV
jgi:2-desacetyl-2-hydroxyethyl bacteriochlorophyllide A dehydrogenase